MCVCDTVIGVCVRHSEVCVCVCDTVRGVCGWVGVKVCVQYQVNLYCLCKWAMCTMYIRLNGKHLVHHISLQL